MYLHEKHFTLEEARSILTVIKPKVIRMVELKKILDSKGYDVYRHRYFGGMGPDGEKQHPPELEELVEIVQELDSIGVLVKGLDQGLIDFPHIRGNGEEVYLCWKIDEDDIYFWHGISDGFAGRRHISEI
jgi:hypothetical protein